MAPSAKRMEQSLFRDLQNRREENIEVRRKLGKTEGLREKGCEGGMMVVKVGLIEGRRKGKMRVDWRGRNNDEK